MDPMKKRIRHVKRLAEAAVPLKHHWETPGPGRGKKLPPKLRVQSGNRSQYLVNRIARDRPDVLEQMRAGEFAYVRQAAIAAGIIAEGRSPGSRLRQPAAEASGSAAVSRRRSWLPAPESWRSTSMTTPVREAHDNRPRADAGCRRLSEVSSASPAGALSPRDHLFSEFPWSAGSERATAASQGRAAAETCYWEGWGGKGF